MTDPPKITGVVLTYDATTLPPATQSRPRVQHDATVVEYEANGNMSVTAALFKAAKHAVSQVEAHKHTGVLRVMIALDIPASGE